MNDRIPAGGQLPPSPVPPQSGQALARSASLIGATTLTSRVLGLIREQVMAYLFGAGNATDAFNVAFRIPNLVRDLFAEGAMSAAFVPTFTRVLADGGRAAAWRLGSQVVNALLVTTGVAVVLGVVFAQPLLMVFAGDYAAIPGKLELTVTLTRVMLPFLILVSLAAASMGMLNSLNRFFVPALAPAVFNVCSIVTTLLLLPVLSRLGVAPILAMAIGVVIGGCGQVAIQWPQLRREGFQYEPRLDIHDPALRQVLILIGPGVLGLAATQINIFVNTWLATGVGTGAVSWLNYAFRLMYLPLGLFGVSVATVSVPAIARRAAAGDVDGIRHAVCSGVSLMLALTIPASFGLILLARPIVALLFERGHFLPSDTAATAAALSCYAIGLAGYSIIKVATPTFYALGESRTPVVVSAATVLTNAVVNSLLVRRFGFQGLAFGTSIAALANAATLLWLLRRRLGGLEEARLAGLAGRALAAGAATAVTAWAVERGLDALLPGHGVAIQALRVGSAIGGGLAVLAVLAHVMRIEELNDAARAIVRRLHPDPDA